MTRRIDGRAVAARVRAEVALEAARAWPDRQHAPGLSTILVGDDPASAVYVAAKRRAVREAGMRDFHVSLPATVTQAALADTIDRLAGERDVAGILLQLPLPNRLDAGPLINRIPPEKDVDGLTTTSAGLLARDQAGLRPCTPAGVVELLDSEGITIEGAKAVVVGRSDLVGRPMGQMLLNRDATVTVTHKETRDLIAATQEADILVVATGVCGLIGREHVGEGATVVDVGIHRTPSGLTGDVRASELEGWVKAITPVPGGVGPMTIAMLMANTLRAALRSPSEAQADSRTST